MEAIRVLCIPVLFVGMKYSNPQKTLSLRGEQKRMDEERTEENRKAEAHTVRHDELRASAKGQLLLRGQDTIY